MEGARWRRAPAPLLLLLLASVAAVVAATAVDPMAALLRHPQIATVSHAGRWRYHHGGKNENINNNEGVSDNGALGASGEMQPMQVSAGGDPQTQTHKQHHFSSMHAQNNAERNAANQLRAQEKKQQLLSGNKPTQTLERRSSSRVPNNNRLRNSNAHRLSSSELPSGHVNGSRHARDHTNPRRARGQLQGGVATARVAQIGAAPVEAAAALTPPSCGNCSFDVSGGVLSRISGKPPMSTTPACRKHVGCAGCTVALWYTGPGGSEGTY